MAQASIPVDVFNPGQVFACMGLLEMTDVLIGNVEGRFNWGPPGDAFELHCSGNESPIRAAITFLRTADVKWLSPYKDLRERDGGETEVLAGISASRAPKAPDLPAVLRGRLSGIDREVPFGYWADGSGRFATTFKKSTNGASSFIRVKNALDAVGLLDEVLGAQDPLNQFARTESLFRLDPRGVVVPLQGGFSPDSLRKGGIDVRVATYPLCELLAVIGLQHARPDPISARQFAYNVWDRPLPPMLARAAVGGGLGIGGVRRFVVEHIEVKKGGDRRMNQTTEELTA